MCSGSLTEQRRHKHRILLRTQPGSSEAALSSSHRAPQRRWEGLPARPTNASSWGQRLAPQNLEAAAAGPGTDTAHPKARSLPPAARLQPLGKR